MRPIHPRVFPRARAITAVALAAALAGATAVAANAARAATPAGAAKPPRPAAQPVAPAAAPAAAAAAEPASAAPAQARSPLQQAQALYDAAQFQQAADLIGSALRNGLVSGDDVTASRSLRARCLVKLGKRLEAKEAWKAILHLDPSFRLDQETIPPDEFDVYRLAKSEFDSELLEAGRRTPASIGGLFGFGQAINQDLADLASSAGAPPADDFQSNAEFGYSVRFPLRPRWSLDFSLMRLRAKTEDKLPPTRNAHATYVATETPVVGSVMYQLNDGHSLRFSGFAGLGVLPADATIQFDQTLVSGRLIPMQLVGRATGYYLHAGFETEYMLAPRFAISIRGLVRRANSGDLDWPRSNFEIYESYPASVLGNRSVDFSGFAVHAGVRAYIGY